jgi:hypothetical protein
VFYGVTEVIGHEEAHDMRHLVCHIRQDSEDPWSSPWIEYCQRRILTTGLENVPCHMVHSRVPMHKGP